MNKRPIYTKGGSIIEMIVSFGILALAITAVILVSFGNQENAVGSELNNKALYLAEELIEDAYLNSFDHVDFLNLDDIPLAEIPDTPFWKELIVTPIGPGDCAKKVEAQISWNVGPAGPQETSLTNVFTDIEASQALGGDCPTEELEDTWDNPDDINIAHHVFQGIKANGIDVKNGYVYLTTDPNTQNKKDFFVYFFDEDAETLVFEDSLDVAPSEKMGLVALDVADGYAYVVRQSNTAQFMVIDVTTPEDPSLKWSITLPTTNPAKPPKPTSVYFYNDRVFIGALNESATKEFFVFDVSNVATAAPTPDGDLELGRDVRAVIARDDYAYLATTDNSKELTVVDVSGSVPVTNTNWGYDAAGSNDGTTLTLSEGIIYLGRMQNTPAAANDIFLIDESKTHSSPTSDGLLKGQDLGISNNSYLTGIVVRETEEKTFAFFGIDNPTAGLQIWDVTDPATMHLNSPCGDPNFAENNTGIDMEGDYLFTANKSNDEIRVFYDKDVACTP